MTPAEMLADAIRSQGHRNPGRDGRSRCVACARRWPCDEAEALAAWDKEQAQLKARYLAREAQTVDLTIDTGQGDLG